MKKRTLIILSCLVSGGAFAQETPTKVKPTLNEETIKKLEINQDEILDEMRKRGIVSEIPGFPMPLVNYGQLAMELQKAGQEDEDVVFVLKNVKDAFDIFTEEDIKKRNLTEILDQMGILERRDDASRTGTICM